MSVQPTQVNNADRYGCVNKMKTSLSVSREDANRVRKLVERSLLDSGIDTSLPP